MLIWLTGRSRGAQWVRGGTLFEVNVDLYRSQQPFRMTITDSNVTTKSQRKQRYKMTTKRLQISTEWPPKHQNDYKEADFCFEILTENIKLAVSITWW